VTNSGNLIETGGPLGQQKVKTCG